jgi:hypothetical protein
MEIKIFLGSLGVVAILILVSFTNVVGVQSTTFSSLKESPLFNVRLKRAINEGSKDILTSDYLGKGAEIIISIPPQDNQIYLFQEIIDKIREMNDREFSAFKQIIIRYLIKEKLIQYKNGSRVVYLFNQIEYNTDEINVVHQKYRRIKILNENATNYSSDDYPFVSICESDFCPEDLSFTDRK